jgi:CspA family cold shock protein
MPHGTVVDFDDDKGWGAIAEEGGPQRFFHCTAIADGTRTIEVGAEVTFEVTAGHNGRYEATAVTPSG